MNRTILTLFLAATLTGKAADLKLTSSGLEISAGTLGSFILTYPEFSDQANAVVHKIIEVKASSNTATVRYEGGAECDVSIRNNELTTRFKGVAADVKSWKMSALIDIQFSKGGAWKIGDQAGPFPSDKPKVPQIASLNATTFTLNNAQGQSLSFTTPDFAFQQLTDNREWNWAVFNWQFILPFNASSSTAKVLITSDLAASAKLIDTFGQSISANFPNKLTRMEELKTDLASEQSYYDAIQTPSLDRFGGLPESSLKLEKTGFFHIEQQQGQSWLVDPDGHLFFHLGVCGFAPSDDYTYVKGREDIYEWLPKTDGEFASAYRAGDAHFSFYVANTIRKFGQPYTLDRFAERMIQRVRKWGFNSIGAFSPTPPKAHVAANFPYVASLPINEWEGVPRIPGAHEVWDPYDAETEKKITENLTRELPAKANDPLLIGYFIVNEPRYDELPRVIPSLNGKQACKRRLVNNLKAKYSEIAAYNTAWQMNAQSFDELIDAGLSVSTDAAKADVKAFVSEFMETYFRQIETLYRKHDAHHLLLGSRLQPITIQDESLCQIMGKHVDVVSYNYYTYGVDTESLKRIHGWCGGRPMMLSEFFWASSKDSGLTGGRDVSSQQQRGLAYRNYVEQSAALGFVIGIEWFTLIDQATTGRWFSKYNGESYNTGLLSVADRPWKDMLTEMMKTNHSLYDVLLHKRPPFAWDDSRFQIPQTKP